MGIYEILVLLTVIAVLVAIVVGITFIVRKTNQITDSLEAKRNQKS